MEMYKLLFEDGRTIYRLPTQKVEVFDFVRKPKIDQPRVWEILTCEELYRRTSLKIAKLYFRLGANTSEKEIDFVIHPYVIGALLGDGSIGKTITINKPYTDFISRFTNLLPYGYKLTKQTEIVHLITRVDKTLPSFKRLLASTGIHKSLAHEKYIQPIYFEGSFNQRKELLKGLMDTDGSSSSGKSVSFYTCSSSLALGVRLLVQSLGGIAKVTKAIRETKIFNGVEKSIREEYCVRIKYPRPWELFTIQHKAANLIIPSRFSNNPKLKLVGITKQLILEEATYCDDEFVG